MGCSIRGGPLLFFSSPSGAVQKIDEIRNSHQAKRLVFALHKLENMLPLFITLGIFVLMEIGEVGMSSPKSKAARFYEFASRGLYLFCFLLVVVIYDRAGLVATSVCLAPLFMLAGVLDELLVRYCLHRFSR